MTLLSSASDWSMTKRFLTSAEKYGWKPTILQIPWKGHGARILALRDYLKNNPQIKDFLWCDSFDAIFQETPSQFKDKLDTYYPNFPAVISGEANIFPEPDKLPEYDRVQRFLKHGKFRFVNGGIYYFKSELYISLFEKYKTWDEDIDQRWLAEVYLGEGNLQIDFDQHLFFNIIMTEEGKDFVVKEGILQTPTQYFGNVNIPTIVHDNGGKGYNITKLFGDA